MNDQAEAVSQPTEGGDTEFPGIWASLGWVLLFMLLQLAAFVIAISIAIHFDASGRGPMELFEDLKFRAPAAIISLLGASALMILLLGLYLRKNGRLARIGLMSWSRLDPARTIAAAVVLVGAGLAFSYVYATYVIPDTQSQLEMRKLFAALPDTFLTQAMLFLAVAIIAPILEEVLFRGLLQTAFARKLPISVAIIASATVFALVHGQPYAVPQLMALGAVFGLLYHLTGSLRVTIIAHALNNAAALLLG